MSAPADVLLVDGKGGLWHVGDAATWRGRDLALQLGSRRAERRLFIPCVGQPRAYVFGPRESRQSSRPRLLRQLRQSRELPVGALDPTLVDAILDI